MTYATEQAAITRTPCQVVVMTLDACSLTNGVAPCTATAADECFNTFYTCRDVANYDITTKTYKFTSNDVALPFSALPYLETIAMLPTEIKEDITIQGRVKLSFLDEPHSDIGIDPYYSTRSSIQGTFWKKLVARNPNYKGRLVKIYDGFVGLAEGDFVLRWQGKIESIIITGKKAVVECVDGLADLSSVSYPEKIDAELNINITETDTAIVLSSILKADGTQIDSSGYVQIEDEIIYYTSVTAASNQINVPAGGRGYFSTTAAEHSDGERVTLVKYFAPQNPFTLLKSLWDDAGGDYTSDFDTAEWTKWQTWPREDVNFSTIITEDQTLTAKEAFWEIANILDLHIWQNENQKITVRRNMGNDPDRTYIDLTDNANIIVDSGSVDFNDEDRKTRIIHYWGKVALSKVDEYDGYARVEITVLADEESVNGFNDIEEEEIFNRWVSLRFLAAKDAIPFITSTTRRRAYNRSKARPLVMASVELKDGDVVTGSVVRLDTDERLDIYGNNIEINHIVVKRSVSGNRINLTLKELPQKRICIIAPAGHPTYANSSVAQREYGYISGAKDQLMPNGDPGYVIW